MSNMHRIHWIDAQIRAARYPNARTIADHFEISSRQAARDIEYLRYSMGAPLTYSQEHNGYYYEDQTFALPALMMTSHEQESLSYLAAQYKSMGSESAIRMANLFERLVTEHPKVTKTEIKEDLPIVTINETKATNYGLLQRAVSQRHELLMRYMNNKNEVNERVINPYKLFVRQGLEYIVGYCRMRQDIRVFRLDRIKELKELETTFQVDPAFDGNQYGESTVFLMRSPYIARIHFIHGLPSKLKPDTEAEGENIFRIPFFNSTTFISELLTHSSDFSIVSPDWLRQRLMDRLKRIWHLNYRE